VIAQRANLGSKDPASIALPSFLGTVVTAIVAVLVAKALSGVPRFAAEKYPAVETPAAGATTTAAPDEGPSPKASPVRSVLAIVGFVALLAGAGVTIEHLAQQMGGTQIARELLSKWLLPVLMLAIIAVGFGRQVKVYDAFVTGAKEAFAIAVTIIPFLVAIMVAVGMLRESGALGAFVDAVHPITAATGFPGEAVTMALIRPLSGQGAFGVMTDAMKTYGPDSPIGYLVSLLNGSSETTFYVLALYFGSVQVKAIRHTLLACLASDAVGLVVTTVAWRAYYG
jgi:spore maturation protein SpmB